MTFISAQSGNVTVKVTLFGEVTPERLAVEQARAQHRAQQLSK